LHFYLEGDKEQLSKAYSDIINLVKTEKKYILANCEIKRIPNDKKINSIVFLKTKNFYSDNKNNKKTPKIL